MKALLKRFLRYLAFEHGKATVLYKKVCSPDGLEWTALIKKRRSLYEIGAECSIQVYANIVDPRNLIEQRGQDFDATIEPALQQARAEFFFGQA